MLTNEQKSCIRIVARGLKRRLPEAEIVRQLIPFGLSQENAPKAFDLIQHGIQSGVCAAVTNGISAQQNKRGQSELYDAAFDEGYKAFRNQARLTWFWRLVAIFGALIAIAVLWRRLGG